MYNISSMKETLRAKLSPKRYEHTLGVEYTCCALAMRYGEDMEKARIAGLLHDCAKHYSGNELLAFCQMHNLSVNEYEEVFPELLHAKVGAKLAQIEYGVEDNDILKAIEYHTTGKPNMSLLDKIVYIADYMEPNRDRAPYLSKIRALAFSDFDTCLVEILGGILSYLESTGSVIDPLTKATYEYYSK